MTDPPVIADRAVHTLVAFTSLNADAAGQECAVTAGDVLQVRYMGRDQQGEESIMRIFSSCSNISHMIFAYS
jgi:hypothetical protein